MLTETQLLQVYELLDQGMSSSDCGGPCEKFCCTSVAVKYLLPGEGRVFSKHHPLVPVIRKPWYDQIVQKDCCCTRAHRMFCCRAFPFRPTLHPETGAVVDLHKPERPAFFRCWIESPLEDWKGRAIKAWSIVLDDPDNRLLYGRVQLLSQHLDDLGDRFYEIPEEEIDSYLNSVVDAHDPSEIEGLYREYFTLG